MFEHFSANLPSQHQWWYLLLLPIYNTRTPRTKYYIPTTRPCLELNLSQNHSALSWPLTVKEKFFTCWAAGTELLPAFFRSPVILGIPAMAQLSCRSESSNI